MNNSKITEVVQPNLTVLNNAMAKLNGKDADVGDTIRHIRDAFPSAIVFAESPTGWLSKRIVVTRAEDGVPISKRAVVISAMPDNEEATTVVFEDFDKVTEVVWKKGQPPLQVNKSTTRHYQPLQYMGRRADGSSRSKAYAISVGQRCLDDLPEEIVKWIVNGDVPSATWVGRPEQLATFVESDNAYFAAKKAEEAKQAAMKNI